METTVATPKPSTKKGPSAFLIGLLIVVLIGGGVGVYFFLKPKKDDGSNSNNSNNNGGSQGGGASGRNVTNTRFPLTPEQIAALTASPSVGPQPGETGFNAANPIYYKDPVFLTAVEMEYREIQTEISGERMDAIRALYNIGEGMMGRDKEEQECIEQLFEQLPNVDFKNNPNRKYLQFPVYGTLEIKGSLYRAELQNLIDSGWEGLNLTRLRDPDEPWVLKEIGLNLLVGTTWENTPTPHQVQMSLAPRNELNFFKKFNRCWVSDWHLADKYVDKRNSKLVIIFAEDPNARACYCATGMYGFVQRWIAEIDRLDEMVRKEAYESLIKTEDNPNGRYYVTYVNPATGKDDRAGKGDKMNG